MHNDYEKIAGSFEHQADKLFMHYYNHFQSTTNTLNRQEDDNVFLHTAARHSFSLKQALTQLALQLIEENKTSIENISQVQQLLTNQITGYVNRFDQKTKQW